MHRSRDKLTVNFAVQFKGGFVKYLLTKSKQIIPLVSEFVSSC